MWQLLPSDFSCSPDVASLPLRPRHWALLLFPFFPNFLFIFFHLFFILVLWIVCHHCSQRQQYTVNVWVNNPTNLGKSNWKVACTLLCAAASQTMQRCSVPIAIQKSSCYSVFALPCFLSWGTLKLIFIFTRRMILCLLPSKLDFPQYPRCPEYKLKQM